MAARALFTSSSSASGSSASAIEQHLSPVIVNEEDGSIEVESLTAINSLAREQSFVHKDGKSEAEMIIPKAVVESSVQSCSAQHPVAPLDDGVHGYSDPIDLPAPSPDEVLALHFPSLMCTAASDVPFPGLDAAEFFAVFFSDEAPYSLKEFHQNRGDTDISFGSWDERIPNATAEKEPWCLNIGAWSSTTPLPPPSSIACLERMLTFKTLTKSYFGPAYASATKTQRASLASRNLLVVENRTRLADVPYGDRFEVLDRWTIVASPEDGFDRDGGGEAPYTSRLTVTCQVNMIKPCTWESQIRKKTLSTVTDLAESWCEKATKALRAAEKRKKQRLREEQLVQKGETNRVGKGLKKGEQDKIGHSPLSAEPAAPLDSEDRVQQQEDTDPLLSLKKHQKRMQDLEQRIAAGDREALDLVEVIRKNGRRESLPDFCEVLGSSVYGNIEDATKVGQSQDSTEPIDGSADSLYEGEKDKSVFSNSELQMEQGKNTGMQTSVSPLNKGRKSVLKRLTKAKKR
mmetsp:Transcript_27425/g.80663  ORF Transcript_27425/g.80663 Transcript_27425/m.80663 type:complete len:517 (-) Transcript_27425:185-1735(-)